MSGPHCATSITAGAAAAAGNSNTGCKARILFLHGYAQNADSFRKKTGAIRKSLEGTEVVCVTAPHLITTSQSDEVRGVTSSREDQQDEGPRAWYFAREPTIAARETSPKIVYVGWEETLEYFAHIFTHQGPFDGVLGFSQGATTAAVLTAILTRPSELQPACFRIGASQVVQPPFKFAVLISGYFPRDSLLQDILNKKDIPSSISSTPTMFVLGDSDTLVAPERTQELAAARYFADLHETSIKWVRHAGGHFVPGNASYRRAMVAFIEAHLCPTGSSAWH